MFIELHNISRWFGNNQALVDVNLSLETGRIGLLGPNGAGKSTLMKILLGLLPPSSGTGRVLDHDLRQAGTLLRRSIGYMSEADSLIPGVQGAEYVALAGELYGMSRKQALRRAHEVLTYLDLGDARYRKLEEYSTGMKQRLKLAQALVHDPPVLLLDEPTSGLDPAGRDAMLRLLLELGKNFGKSLIVSTHLLADVEAVCEQVVILFEGQVRGQGAVAELCARRRERFVLRVQGDVEAFRAALTAGAVRVLTYNAKGEFHVSVPPTWQPRDAFVTAASVGAVVRAILPDDETLEEMFLRTAAA